MQIHLKTAGLLGKYLPPGSARNKASVSVPEGACVTDVMKQLGFPAGDSYLVTLNGAIVPISQREGQVLSDDDQLSIMPPLKGG